MDIVYLIETFGFEVVMIIGLGYFVFFVWQTINKIINPALDSMKATIIRLTDQLRLFCLLYTSPSPRDVEESRMPSSA